MVETGGVNDGGAAVVFDPVSAEYFEDPYPTYRRLRDEAPVYRSEQYGFYALSRYDDVVAAARDWQTYTSERGIDLNSLITGEKPGGGDILIMIDPPRHDRMRGLVSRVFTPRAVGSLEPMIREVITGYFDEVEGRAEVDVIGDIAGPFPVEIICRMLGVPPDMRQQVRHWLDRTLTRDVGEFGYGPDAMEAMIAMGTYFYGLAVEKRASPTDDMLSRLTQVTYTDEHGETTMLDDVEIAGFGTLLGGAGAETVTKLVGNAAVLFDTNPDQWRRVLDDPTTIPGAVEEILRYHPPAQYQGRYTTRDVELHGTTIPADSPIMLITGSATRDERAIEEPDRFDIGRPASLSIGFGYGIHSCLGAALARMESRIAIAEMARRWPRYEVDHSGLRRVQMTNVAGYSHVPVHIAA
jgi:cytochrome P450